jgi:hypothetical protein
MMLLSGKLRHGLHLMMIVPVCFLLSSAALAQQTESNLRVTVKATDGTPISGALIELVDPSGRAITQGMSGASGYRLFRAPNGTYRIRVKRIGFEPSLTETIQLSTDMDRTVVVSDKRITLTTVVVTSKSQCSLGQNQGVDVVWEEISKALTNTRLSRGDMKDVTGVRTFTRRLSDKGQVISADTTAVVVSTNRPFGAVDPKLLRNSGYVRGNPQYGWTYFAPDETVLLSPEFIETHCFKLVRNKDHPNQVGLSFEPSPSRKLSDVSGTLWLEESSSELREINFRYVHVDALPRLKAGGDVHFRRMASGAWIVDSWVLRFPNFERRMAGPGYEILAETGYTENGGFVAVVR